MRITLQTTGSTQEVRLVVVETGRDDLDVFEFSEELLQPALLAYGYGQATVKALFEEEAQ